MKRAVTVAAALFLSGCGITTPTIDSEAVAIVVAQVQELAVKVCSFLPTDGTVVEIIKATQGGETALAIANAICKAVTASAANTAPGNSLFASEKKECPVVAGVCVEGQFVDPKEYEKTKDDPIPDAPPPLKHEEAPPATATPEGQPQ